MVINKLHKWNLGILITIIVIPQYIGFHFFFSCFNRPLGVTFVCRSDGATFFHVRTISRGDS